MTFTIKQTIQSSKYKKQLLNICLYLKNVKYGLSNENLSFLTKQSVLELSLMLEILNRYLVIEDHIIQFKKDFEQEDDLSFTANQYKKSQIQTINYFESLYLNQQIKTSAEAYNYLYLLSLDEETEVDLMKVLADFNFLQHVKDKSIYHEYVSDLDICDLTDQYSESFVKFGFHINSKKKLSYLSKKLPQEKKEILFHVFSMLADIDDIEHLTELLGDFLYQNEKNKLQIKDEFIIDYFSFLQEKSQKNKLEDIFKDFLNQIDQLENPNENLVMLEYQVFDMLLNELDNDKAIYEILKEATAPKMIKKKPIKAIQAYLKYMYLCNADQLYQKTLELGDEIQSLINQLTLRQDQPLNSEIFNQPLSEAYLYITEALFCLERNAESELTCLKILDLQKDLTDDLWKNATSIYLEILNKQSKTEKYKEVIQHTIDLCLKNYCDSKDEKILLVSFLAFQEKYINFLLNQKDLESANHEIINYLSNLVKHHLIEDLRLFPFFDIQNQYQNLVQLSLYLEKYENFEMIFEENKDKHLNFLFKLFDESKIKKSDNSFGFAISLSSNIYTPYYSLYLIFHKNNISKAREDILKILKNKDHPDINICFNELILAFCDALQQKINLKKLEKERNKFLKEIELQQEKLFDFDIEKLQKITSNVFKNVKPQVESEENITILLINKYFDIVKNTLLKK
jgi:hypothetical protein